MTAPAWLKQWAARDGGISSFTVAQHLIPEAAEYMEGRIGCFGLDAPYDYADCARIVRLLDLCERYGRPLRHRMGEMAEVPAWRAMAPHWPVVEEAMQADDDERKAELQRTQYRKDGRMRRRFLKMKTSNPCRTYLVVCALRGQSDIGRLAEEAREFYDPKVWLDKIGYRSPSTPKAEGGATCAAS